MMIRVDQINLLLVDDHTSIIGAMKYLFRNSSRINIIGDCSDKSEVVPFIKNHKIDVIFIDIQMKNNTGIEIIKIIKSYNAKIKIIGFSLMNHPAFIRNAAASDVDGFISKYDANKGLIEKELFRVMRM